MMPASPPPRRLRVRLARARAPEWLPDPGDRIGHSRATSSQTQYRFSNPVGLINREADSKFGSNPAELERD